MSNLVIQGTTKNKNKKILLVNKNFLFTYQPHQTQYPSSQ